MQMGHDANGPCDTGAMQMGLVTKTGLVIKTGLGTQEEAGVMEWEDAGGGPVEPATLGALT